jgi:hypothetical protein
MIQHKGKPVQLKLFAFLCAVEIEDGGRATPEAISLKLADALSFVEDVGRTEVECLGEITQTEPDEPIA